jgi:hypothetical protein
MSNFRGTKGRWRVYPSEAFSNEFYICDVGCVFGEQEANALLISKAPELLEMLKHCVDILNNPDAFDLVWKLKVKEMSEQLIKEATEL